MSHTGPDSVLLPGHTTKLRRLWTQVCCGATVAISLHNSHDESGQVITSQEQMKKRWSALPAAYVTAEDVNIITVSVSLIDPEHIYFWPKLIKSPLIKYALLIWLCTAVQYQHNDDHLFSYTDPTMLKMLQLSNLSMIVTDF